MYCLKHTKAFGAMYSDGLSLNKDKRIKTSETPSSILSPVDWIIHNFKNDIDVGMIVSDTDGKYLVTKIDRELGRVEIFDLEKNREGTHPNPQGLSRIHAMQQSTKNLLKCGDKVSVKVGDSEVTEGTVNSVDYGNRDFMYLVNIDGVDIWCGLDRDKNDYFVCNQCVNGGSK